MSSENISVLNTATDALAVVFVEMRHQMLAEWALRVKTAIPAAAEFGKPILLDTLPVLYDDIAQAVRPELPRPFATPRSDAATAHGRERARMTRYSLPDLVLEIQLFRQALFGAIKTRGVHVEEREGEIIGHAIEIALLDSISSYSLVSAQMNETFVSSLSHDLRNPLHVANAAAQLLQLRTADPDLTGLAKRVCEKINEADAMIQTLLDAAALKNQMKLKLNLSRFDIMLVVNDVCGDIPLLGKPVNIIGKSVVGHWCRVSMKRLLENLISNAQKYGDPQKGVTVRVQRLGGQMLISVHNEGQPIPEQEINRLFHPFERMENVSVTGWGLGLPFVQNVAESHGGSVLVDSAQERGTTFTVSMPINARPYVSSVEDICLDRIQS